MATYTSTNIDRKAGSLVELHPHILTSLEFYGYLNASLHPPANHSDRLKNSLHLIEQGFYAERKR